MNLNRTFSFFLNRNEEEFNKLSILLLLSGIKKKPCLGPSFFSLPDRWLTLNFFLLQMINTFRVCTCTSISCRLITFSLFCGLWRQDLITPDRKLHHQHYHFHHPTCNNNNSVQFTLKANFFTHVKEKKYSGKMNK